MIFIEKNLHQNFLRLYMPSFFIIFVGWLSFWVDRGQVSARVKFGTLCLLAMITEDAGIHFLMSDTIHSSALDVWFAVCLIFATLVPLEFTVVHAIDQYQKAMVLMEDGKKGKTECNHCGQKTIGNQLLFTTSSSLAYGLKDVTGQDLHQMHCTKPSIKYEFVKRLSSGEIEKKFRILYVLAFIVFQVIYWGFYLNYEEDYDGDLT